VPHLAVCRVSGIHYYGEPPQPDKLLELKTRSPRRIFPSGTAFTKIQVKNHVKFRDFAKFRVSIEKDFHLDIIL